MRLALEQSQVQQIESFQDVHIALDHRVVVRHRQQILLFMDGVLTIGAQIVQMVPERSAQVIIAKVKRDH